MKMKLFAAAAALLIAGAANAQEKEIKENPWFVSAQGGASVATGDIDFGKLISPQASVSFGKYFNPVWGARLTVQGWEGRGPKSADSELAKDFYQGSIIADGLANLSQAIKTSDSRVFDLSALLGLGFNRNFSYGENSLLGRVGLIGQFKVSKVLSLDIEATLNGVSDRWNGLDDHKIDLFTNVGIGFTYRIGTGYKCSNCQPLEVINEDLCCQPEPEVITVHDTVIVEKIVEAPQPAIESLPSANVFFSRAKSDISADEDAVIRQLIKDVNNRPVYFIVVGYADKKTGNPTINMKYAKDRAERVAAALNEKYGVDKADIKTEWKGDTVQPFAENDRNRVAIITVEKK